MIGGGEGVELNMKQFNFKDMSHRVGWVEVNMK